MQKIITILLVLVLTTAFLAVPAQASRQGPPTGSCPPGFMLHSVMHHEGDHHHDHHVGLEFDLNQDGFICVMHIANYLHVHVDNVIQ
jgi:hypothetical protein